ncbi:GntR family transcriptional regulator [Roseibium aggregatum]|uniref:GntR family transcriptional regulator n=1 Tax=Roseibium aggregatum TaxID=187304 RepID=A0A939J4E5_9HYPH|nr:GntR family transcriptional regulator [Roseibium aggregatum]MBN9671532.1 GntR family transcriptional regulator [Roseibium aggregatum]
MTDDQISAPGQRARGRGANSRGSKVYQELLERMRNGMLKPGTRLREDEIGIELDVSRTPVREAFNRLHARGLVESSRGGWTVAELSRGQIMELYALRAVLEGAAARFAAENAQPADLAALRIAASGFEKAASGETARANANIVYHRTIYAAAHNAYLERMLEDLNDSLALLPSTTFSVSGRSQAAIAEHQAITDAILARAPAQAETSARNHIENAMDARLRMLFSDTGR